jgi:hypothetical protein
VTQLAFEGLSENEIGRARISMMARSCLLHARAGYRSARPVAAAQQIQLATHGRSFKKIGRQLGQPYFGWRFSIGRSTSSYVGTWVLSDHDSSAAPQTVQIASPVCGAKNFSSVRLYSAPQLHCTIVAIPGICISDRRFSSLELCHNRTTTHTAAVPDEESPSQTRLQRNSV